MHSEEVVKLNVALRYCDQLKNNLQASILHVQMLNRKYNTIDYTQSFSESVTGSTRKNNSMERQNNDRLSPTNKQRIRAVKDIKHNFNSIIVNGIKLRREVETTTIQLKLLTKDYQPESPYIIKRRLQSANYSPVSSPSGCRCRCRHGRCLSDTIGGRDRSTVTSVKKASHSYSAPSTSQQTPQRKRKSFHNRSAMSKADSTSSDVNVKKFRFQSTPIRTNGTSSNATKNSTNLAMDDSFSLPNTPTSIADELNSSPMNSPIKPCVRNTSNASRRQYDSPKRICWTPIVNVRRVSIYQ